MKFSFGRKKTGVDKSKRKRSKPRSGLFFLLILSGLLFGGAAAQYAYTYTKTTEYVGMIEADRGKIQEAEQALMILKFYEERRSKIENNHRIYESARSGPAKKEDLEPFSNYGFENFGLFFIKDFKQPGVQLSGTKTEFQRILEAVSQVEAKYPLLQFTKMQMDLPEGVAPLAEEPTYLDCSAELYSPRL